MRKFQVWAEGYLTNGMENIPCPAKFMGEFDAHTFAEACQQAFPSKEEKQFLKFSPNQQPRFWLCRLFDNETDARKAFG